MKKLGLVLMVLAVVFNVFSYDFYFDSADVY